ncbi:hypothetical protein E8E11_002535 [Didymella keratinophila]|nr:hypothetical protein E8E11_002535 [Didymella keratinophila]
MAPPPHFDFGTIPNPDEEDTEYKIEEIRNYYDLHGANLLDVLPASDDIISAPQTAYEIRDACPYKILMGHFDDSDKDHFVFGVFKWSKKVEFQAQPWLASTRQFL